MPLCLVACGGDGTLMETAGGMAGGAEVRLACLPCGSANDFIRCFGTAEEFADLDALVHGRVRMVDAIRCGQALSLNLCSMGMDADVADKMRKYKGFPLVSGSLAYELAIVDVFCHRIGKHLQVEMGYAGRDGAPGRTLFLRPGGQRTILRRRVSRRAGCGAGRRSAGFRPD